MSTRYPVLDNRPIDQWKVVELKEELRRRKIPQKGLKEELVKKLDEAIRKEMELHNDVDASATSDPVSDPQVIQDKEEVELANEDKIETVGDTSEKSFFDATIVDTDDFAADVDNVVNDEADADGVKVEDVPTMGDANMDGTIDGKCVNEILVENKDIDHESVNTQFESSSLDEGSFDGKVKSTNDDTANVNEGAKVEDVDKMENTSLDGKEMEEAVITISKEIKESATESEVVQLESSRDLKLDEKHMEWTPPAEDAMLSPAEPNNQVLEVSLDGKEMEETVITISKEIKESATESEVVQLESSRDLKLEEKHEEWNPPAEDAMLSPAELNNQVLEVSPDLGFQVKCESYSSDSVSLNEKNKLKDNLNADNFHLELEVKPEMVQPSSDNVLPIVDELHQLKDGKELREVEDKYASNMEFCKKEDSADGGSPEKLNLDRSSGDESMDEDVLECKHIESGSTSVDLGERKEVSKVNTVEEGNRVNLSTGALSPEKMDIAEERVVPATPIQKRKPEGDEAHSSQSSKRQRRWNTETIKVPEAIKGPELQSSNISSSNTPKDSIQPTLNRVFARSDSRLSVDSPKERIVPPSTKPATNSLRIDHFLRPFTLKAVQELLAKSGTVCSFWMDHIKTHCYVTYSSAEEATATRDSLYNLQWPPNGGRLLAAEFVDPKEVKARADAPPQSPGPTTPISPPFQQQPVPPAARPQQQTLRQKLPPPPPLLPPPPPLSGPPPAAARQPLPPPPPAKKVEPAVMTLDDLFKKTKATPRIYYLPLSEEQVAAKTAASQGNKSSRD